MKALVILAVLFGVLVAGIHFYPEKAMEFHVVRRIVREVGESEGLTAGAPWVCTIPEVRQVMRRVSRSFCWTTRAISMSPLKRSPSDAFLVKVWWNVRAALLWGAVGVGIWVSARLIGVLYSGGGELSYRVRWRRRFRKQVYRAVSAADVRLKRAAWVVPSPAYAWVCELRVRHKEVCVDLLKIIGRHGGRTYRVGKGREEGAFGRHVLMIYGAGLKIAEELGLGLEAKGILSICLLSQELGKLGAFDRSGMADWFSFAGPAHQSKSAGVLRSLASFGRLPEDEQAAILRLVAGHHEELLPDGTHRGIRILRSILRRAESYRGDLIGAVEATA